MSGEVVAGIDIGGTRIKAVALSGDGPVAEALLPTPPDIAARPGQVVGEVLAALGREVAAVGVVVPGLVDERSGVAALSANLGWRDLPVPQLVREATGLPVAFGHDVRAGLLGEARYGAARDRDDVLFVPLGTGLAGALLSGGELVAGSAWTGEIGHVVVDPQGVPCGCGARGCLETVVGAAALGRRWAAYTGEDVDARALAQAVADGDLVAQELWDGALRALTGVLAPVLAAAGSELLLLGGGLVNAGELLLQPVREQLGELLPGCVVEVAAASLGERAAALGAAGMALDLVQGESPA